MTPKTNTIYLWRRQISPNNSRTNPESFSNIVFLEIPKSWKSKLWKHRRDGRRGIPTTRLIHSWKSWIWNQYLSKNMKCFYNIWNFEPSELWRYSFQQRESPPPLNTPTLSRYRATLREAILSKCYSYRKHLSLVASFFALRQFLILCGLSDMCTCECSMHCVLVVIWQYGSHIARLGNSIWYPTQHGSVPPYPKINSSIEGVWFAKQCNYSIE